MSKRRRPGIVLALPSLMSDDKGATEDEVQKIDVIRGAEVLGYEGAGREEHSGENAPAADGDLTSDLADNEPKDL